MSPACNCDSVGGISGGECERKTDEEAGSVAGRCICKTNVEGSRCNQCKPGFWNLRRDYPDGCTGNRILFYCLDVLIINVMILSFSSS